MNKVKRLCLIIKTKEVNTGFGYPLIKFKVQSCNQGRMYGSLEKIKRNGANGKGLWFGGVKCAVLRS